MFVFSVKQDTNTHFQYVCKGMYCPPHKSYREPCFAGNTNACEVSARNVQIIQIHTCKCRVEHRVRNDSAPLYSLVNLKQREGDIIQTVLDSLVKKVVFPSAFYGEEL